MVAFVTTLSGTAIASETIAAGRVARSSEGICSIVALRIGGLHRERRLGLHAVERLAHEAGEHAARSGLDVARAPSPWSAAITSVQRTGEVSACTSWSRTSSNGAAVTHERTGTRGSRTSIRSTSSWNGATAGSISGEWKAPPTGSRFARTLRSRSSSSPRSSASSEPDSTSWSGALSLAIVRPASAADLLDRLALPYPHRDHPAAARLLHQAAAGGDQPQAVGGVDRVGGDQGGDLAERMAGHEVSFVAVPKNFVTGERCTENCRLRPARALGGALEEIVGDLGARELQQVGPVAFHRLTHVRGLASLAGKQHRELFVGASHRFNHSVHGDGLSITGRRSPRSGGVGSSDG